MSRIPESIVAVHSHPIRDVGLIDTNSKDETTKKIRANLQRTSTKIKAFAKQEGNRAVHVVTGPEVNARQTGAYIGWQLRKKGLLVPIEMTRPGGARRIDTLARDSPLAVQEPVTSIDMQTRALCNYLDLLHNLEVPDPDNSTVVVVTNDKVIGSLLFYADHEGAIDLSHGGVTQIARPDILTQVA